MRALIVDDERLARLELRRLLAAFPEVIVVAEAHHVAEARRAIVEHRPDLLFLDVQMPGGSGFDVLEGLEPLPEVVFTTAFDAHALRAFDVNALDYLVKPIDPVRLARAIARARAALAASRIVAAPRSPPPPPPYLARVFVRDGERSWLVQLEELPYIESEGNYARLPLGADEPLLARSLAHLEERLDPAVFVRANRRQLLNLRFIESIEPGPEGRLVVHLRGGKEIEMSRRQSVRFKETMRG